MIFWILIILTFNSIISFTHIFFTSNDATILWALLTVNFLFYSGITQSGIIFSSIMKIAKAGWGTNYSRTGEIITLSSAPMIFVLFLILYSRGSGHIFYWALKEPTGPFFWRNILSMTAFYIVSYIYYRKGAASGNNILPSLVIISYVISNTITAWDFGMAIIPDWESSIFPPYYWVGSIFSGTAFLFLGSFLALREGKGTSVRNEDISQMGKLLMGLTLLWIYMFWSQFIVIWYGDIPRYTEPLSRQMQGNYSTPFLLMISLAFGLPFFSLLSRKVRTSQRALARISAIICIGIWINRYLMIIPLFSDGSSSLILTWTGMSLTMGGLAVTLLSMIFFDKMIRMQ